MSAPPDREPCSCTRHLTTAAEVADALRVPIARVYQLAREGLIPSVHIGRQVRFDLREVIAHLRTAANSTHDVDARGAR